MGFGVWGLGFGVWGLGFGDQVYRVKSNFGLGAQDFWKLTPWSFGGFGHGVRV